ncbi:hypothetical protein EX30DRAFT_394752 [Ascodesmis nigricans]|uniref:Uncharacterized protein n=1 Tax=Ascodesmis nigricans TaxID=341454 RepID=A0A4S2N0D0_9PEZI|nr:hypothetical protein EX30DRAFT_394752 [Ascodesmis nigricans]
MRLKTLESLDCASQLQLYSEIRLPRLIALLNLSFDAENMLVDYSDSDASDTESQKTVPPPEPEKKPVSGLAGLLPKPKRRQKDVSTDDGPKKIVVNLPKIDEPELLEQPPSKIRRIGGGGSGLSSMLPAPKKRKEAEAAAETKNGTKGANKPRVLGGASAGAREVGFVRLPGEVLDVENEATAPPKPPPVSGSATMFIPQSVVGKKTIQPMSAFRKKGGKAATGTIKVAGAGVPPPKPKVSLFGSVAASTTSSSSYTGLPVISGEYKPIMLETAQPAPKPNEDVAMDTGLSSENLVELGQNVILESKPANDLAAVVDAVGLDEAAMRQLYGRRGRGKEQITLSNFSVDEEYRKNEINRALGLAEEHKTVRSIKPGKHQLKSLLTAVQSQKDALEDSFAESKRNRQEAGNKYGW